MKDPTVKLPTTLKELLIQHTQAGRGVLGEIWNLINRTLPDLEAGGMLEEYRVQFLKNLSAEKKKDPVRYLVKGLDAPIWKKGCADYLDQCWKIYLRAYREQQASRIPDEFKKATLRFAISPKLQEELAFVKQSFEGFAAEVKLPPEWVERFLSDLDSAAAALRRFWELRLELEAADARSEGVPVSRAAEMLGKKKRMVYYYLKQRKLESAEPGHVSPASILKLLDKS